MYAPRHARPSCLPVRAATVGGLTALLLPLAMTAPALAATAPTVATTQVASQPATAMRISASPTGSDSRSRIGVRLLSGDLPVAGVAVAIDMLGEDGVWRYHGQATTDDEGLAVAHLPFARDTRVRSTFSGSSTVLPKASPEAVVSFTAPAPAPAAAAAAGSLGQQALAIAAQQAGKPYRYGSTGPSSFDCSGFTTYVFKTRLGKSIPRTSAQQAAALPAVSPAAKQPGDLLFFRTGGRVSHVGIYAGGNAMWAAPTTGKVVRLQPIYSSSYTVGRVV